MYVYLKLLVKSLKCNWITCKIHLDIGFLVGMIRRLVPVAAFFIAFATVMTLLLVYMDTTAIRHHQFRMNMTQDYDLLNVAQDDPQLVTYIREVHVRPAVDPHHYRVINTSAYGRPTTRALYIAKLLNNKVNI